MFYVESQFTAAHSNTSTATLRPQRPPPPASFHQLTHTQSHILGAFFGGWGMGVRSGAICLTYLEEKRYTAHGYCLYTVKKRKLLEGIGCTPSAQHSLLCTYKLCLTSLYGHNQAARCSKLMIQLCTCTFLIPKKR